MGSTILGGFVPVNGLPVVLAFLIVPCVSLASLEIDVQSVGPEYEVPDALDPSLPRLPSHDDFVTAVEILESDDDLGSSVSSRRLVPYPAMPVLFDSTEVSGARVIPIGLRSEINPADHEIVAVDVGTERVFRYERRSPPRSIATAHTCGPVGAEQRITKIGTSGSASIVVKKNGVEIWRMFATRPAASGGYWGSGIDLREIHYRGRRVLHRLHVPILNVDYDGNVCGPFRDVVNNENAFVAEGTRVASGFVRTNEIPTTIFETRVDRGTFWGVAVYEDDDRLVLASELSAGWYRYANEYRFSPDGTIEPVFKFDAVHNSCTCEAHSHHVYWRMDIDLDGAKNSISVLTDEGWKAVSTETKFVRGPSARAWRISNSPAGSSVEVRPGSNDGTANAFGAGDAWVLRYKSGEVEDSKLGTTKNAKLDRFVTGESVTNSDLVLWYGSHVRHAPDSDETPHIAGPTLIVR